jgi:putative transposase
MSSQNTVLKLVCEGEPQAINDLNGQSRICNWLYNNLLERAELLKQEFIQTSNPQAAKDLYTKRGLRNLLPKIKKESPFLKVVHSSPLKNTALRLSNAIQSCQKSKKGKRKGKLIRWPKFRAWKRQWFSLFYDEPDKGFKIEGNSLTLSLGMGEDRKQRSLTLTLREAHLLHGKTIRNLRIVSELGLYYAIFAVQKELPSTKPIKKIIALDPNHKNLAYGVGSDGQAIEIASPQWLKVYDKRLDELKRKRDRCNKKSKTLDVLDSKGMPIGKKYFVPSRKWKKSDETLKRALHKRREQTKTFMYTCAHRLFKNYDCVAVGDYTPNGGGISRKMRRAMNNRSLIGRWKKTLSWVATKSGMTFIEYNETGTTRTCHHCDYVEPQGIPVALRQWRCQQCETIHHRDENAGINGLRKVLRDFSINYEGEIPSIVSCSDLAFIKERWAWSVLPSGVHVTSRGQGSEEMSQLQEIKPRAW